MDPSDRLHGKFVARVGAGDLPRREERRALNEVSLKASSLADVFHTQVLCRQIDRVSRKLQARGECHYTIGCAGHDNNAVVALVLRPTDMAFLHYRDAPFLMQRSKQVPGQTPLWDFLLSFTASSEDPVSGGRHKVLGSRVLHVPPQTSTIASHLPKAVGAALSIGLAKKLDLRERRLPDDSIVYCSFGDASANHSTAQGAINAALWHAYQQKPAPILFFCEDNGIGISVRTPNGWIEAAFKGRAGLKYFSCNGLDPIDVYGAAMEAAEYVRSSRAPAFLHMHCLRLLGHAGSDVQAAYLSKDEIDNMEARDPLLLMVSTLVDQGVLKSAEALELYNGAEETVARVAERVIKRPKLASVDDVAASLIPPRRDRDENQAPSDDVRAATFGTDWALLSKPQHLSKLLNWALTDLMLTFPEIVLAGEDIGAKGGVYGVTLKLQARFGADRVMDTLLDEQSILGFGIGAAHNGLLTIPEIQFLAYVHNAEDQIRGEACTLSFFSSGQFTNPMVVRIAGLGYQKGFGGHFHNDNSLAVFRDIPGLVLACPSNGADAVAMLRECVRLAREEQRVVVFVEPIALYTTRDLHEDGDGLWTFPYNGPGTELSVRLGDVGRHGDGEELAIVSYGNGYYLSRQAQKLLESEANIRTRVIDLRWLAPLNKEGLISAIGPCRRVLIVDECRITGSQSEALMALFTERCHDTTVRRVAAEDCFIPLGRAATLPLPNREAIVRAATEFVRGA